MYESLPSYMKEVKGVRVLWAQEYAPYVTIAEMYYEAVEAFDDSMKKFWWHTLVQNTLFRALFWTCQI